MERTSINLIVTLRDIIAPRENLGGKEGQKKEKRGKEEGNERRERETKGEEGK